MKFRNKILVFCCVLAICVTAIFAQDGGSSSQKRRKVRRKLTDQPVENGTDPLSDQQVELSPSAVIAQIKPENETHEMTERAGRGLVLANIVFNCYFLKMGQPPVYFCELLFFSSNIITENYVSFSGIRTRIVK